MAVDDHVEEFVLALLGTGAMLSGLVSDLADALPEGAYPGEEPAAVVAEMVCGSIATVLALLDPRDVRRATELIDMAGARTLEHLRLACDLSRRIHGDDGGVGRAYG
jgi:hypothetical protein